MTDQTPDKPLDALLRRSLIPRGYRPERDADIEKMLAAMDDEGMTLEKHERMLRKINGEEPTFVPLPHSDSTEVAEQLSEQERELVALHRAQGKPLPPDLAAKLKAMEQRAAQPPSDETDDHAT